MDNKINDKICITCKISKNINNYQYRNDTKKYRNQCKQCVSQRHKDKNYSRKSRLKKKNESLGIFEEKEKLPKNKKRCSTCSEIKDISEYYFRKDINKYIDQCKRCRQNKINEYRRNNKDYKLRYNQYRKDKRNNDEKYLLQERLRSRIRKALKSDNANKCVKTNELLGCDLDFFKNYIENQFVDGMNWENRNFHIDHIIPCSSFDLTNEEEQRKCFHYTNLQPLFPIDNLKKSNKIY